MTLEFSILIPTRDRPDTLRYALETVLHQPGEDYEVVVADNCGRPEVRQIVDEARRANPRVKYLRSDIVLPMSENWECGLTQCEGRYITVLGDDDGFLPSTLKYVRSILGETKTKLLGWNVHTYWWPDAIAPWFANRLLVGFNPDTSAWTLTDSRQLLQGFYSGVASASGIPMIYSAFFHRDIIDDAKAQRGRFFWPAEMPPDIVSGIFGLAATTNYVLSTRPLAIRGNSRKSTGTAHWLRALGGERRAEYLTEERKSLEQICHPALVASPNLQIIIGSTKICMKEMYFSDRDDLVVDPRQVVLAILDDLNIEPEAYEVNLADALRLADKIGFAVRPDMIPPRKMRKREPFQGPYGEGEIQGVCVNCDLLGISNVAQAARMAEALTR